MQVMMPPPAEENMKPLPSLPSPTLTNPDLVLPNEPRKLSMLPSPPRYARRERPPSPSYLKHQTTDTAHGRSASNGNSAVSLSKKEKRGLMSRKMMLLRSRTASSGYGGRVDGAAAPARDSAFPSSPTLMDDGDLNGDHLGSKWSTDESSAEEDMSGLPQFLAKYDLHNASATDDELEGSTAVGQHDYPPSTIAGSSDAERLQKEKDEQASAVLSKRAEQILANAKKRLNLMEGNLRGARDLVAPLTAANLKRATSVASYVPPINNFGGITRYVEGGYHYDATTHQTYRTLHAQASNPVIGRDYQGHWRGFSETHITERISPGLDEQIRPIGTPTFTQKKALKGSRSHDSLGLSIRQPGSPFYTKGSPDPNLEPLVEDDDGPADIDTPRSNMGSRTESRDGSYRTSSRQEDLHEQMSSLRGRISALKERAKVDSLRRQSMQSLREPSPLNNATVNAPEFFYTSSPTYGGPVMDTQAGVGSTSLPEDNRVSPFSEREATSTPILTGSRNAFAEQAQRRRQQEYDSDSSSFSAGNVKQKPHQAASHRRTPSGTAVVQSSKHRYSHHQLYRTHDRQGSNGTITTETERDVDGVGTAHDGTSHYGDDEESAVGGSVYEDALADPPPVVVAHEDREDAFDYENFFLHSAMSYYANDARRGSASSEESVDSVETERGPTAAADVLDGYARFDSDSDSPSPATPQTPEKLREIEKNLHQRTFSDESVSSITTFATAFEGLESPGELSSGRVSTAMEWPVPPTSSNGNSRPGTAIPVKPRQIEIARSGSDSSSERADSGLGISGSNNSNNSVTATKRISPASKIPTTHHKSSLSSSATLTSPMLGMSTPLSPRAALAQQRDPATVAVNALLLPGASRQLGLRDKALMFSLVESLKSVCQLLQEGEETSLENRLLRRRLDDARRVLAGGSEVRPGTR